jgi:hypothetical protein
MACGAAEEEGEWVEESEFGSVEQAIAEAAWGTNVVPAGDILTVTSVQNVFANPVPAYGSATCTNAALIGVRGTNKGLVLVQDTSTAPEANVCTQRVMKARRPWLSGGGSGAVYSG